MTDLSHDTFEPNELFPLIPDNFVPGTFLTRLAFPRVYEFGTKEVYFDRVIVDRRRAPLVAQLSPGRVIQPRGFRKESLIPPSMKPRNNVSPDEVLSRLPGERIGGEMSASDRAAQIREFYLADHQKKIWRTMEWMSSSILRTGQVVLSAPDYQAVTLNFGRTNALTKTLLTTARWGESGVSPYDDVDGWMNEVGEACGAPVTVVVMDRKAWAFYIADPKAQKALDRTLGQTASITLGFTPGVPGAPSFKGRDGDVEFYVYNDIQESVDGTPDRLLPDYTVQLIAQGGIEGGILAGLIEHAENNYQKGQFFAHNWIDPDTGAELIETITAMVPAPGRIDATLTATVR